MADTGTLLRSSGGFLGDATRRTADSPERAAPGRAAQGLGSDHGGPDPERTASGGQRIRAAHFQPLLIIGFCVAYLPTALGDVGHRPWLLPAVLLLGAAGLCAWAWGLRRGRTDRHTDRVALLLALIGQIGHTVIVSVAAPGTASRLLPIAVLLIAVHALTPSAWMRRSLQAITMVIALLPFVMHRAATSELLAVVGLLLAIAFAVNAFAGDLVEARRAADAARSRADRQTALLFAVQDLPSDDAGSAEAATAALLASHDLEMVGIVTGRPATAPFTDPSNRPAGDQLLAKRTIVAPLMDAGGEEAALVVRRRIDGPLDDTERALVEVVASHLSSVRVNTVRIERQHDLLRRLTALERTRNSFLGTVSDDLFAPLATVHSTVRRLSGAPDDGVGKGYVPPAAGAVRQPSGLPAEVSQLALAAELLQQTVEAMFALATAQRSRDLERRGVGLDSVVDDLRSRGITVAGRVSARSVLAVPDLLGHALRLWASPPAQLRVDARSDVLCFGREPPRDPGVEDGLIGRLLVTAGGHWCAPGTVAFPWADAEQTTWD